MSTKTATQNRPSLLARRQYLAASLHKALRRDKTKRFFDLLTEHNINDLTDNRFLFRQHTLLIRAVNKGNTAVVKFLLDRNVDIHVECNATRGRKTTAFNVAVRAFCFHKHKCRFMYAILLIHAKKTGALAKVLQRCDLLALSRAIVLDNDIDQIDRLFNNLVDEKTTTASDDGGTTTLHKRIALLKSFQRLLPTTQALVDDKENGMAVQKSRDVGDFGGVLSEKLLNWALWAGHESFFRAVFPSLDEPTQQYIRQRRHNNSLRAKYMLRNGAHCPSARAIATELIPQLCTMGMLFDGSTLLAAIHSQNLVVIRALLTTFMRDFYFIRTYGTCEQQLDSLRANPINSDAVIDLLLQYRVIAQRSRIWHWLYQDRVPALEKALQHGCFQLASHILLGLPKQTGSNVGLVNNNRWPSLPQQQTRRFTTLCGQAAVTGLCDATDLPANAVLAIAQHFALSQLDRTTMWDTFAKRQKTLQRTVKSDL